MMLTGREIAVPGGFAGKIRAYYETGFEHFWAGEHGIHGHAGGQRANGIDHGTGRTRVRPEAATADGRRLGRTPGRAGMGDCERPRVLVAVLIPLDSAGGSGVRRRERWAARIRFTHLSCSEGA